MSILSGGGVDAFALMHAQSIRMQSLVQFDGRAKSGVRLECVGFPTDVPAPSYHLVDPGRAQPRMSFECLLDEVQIWIDHSRPLRWPRLNRSVSSARRTVSGCNPSSVAIVPIFQCSAWNKRRIVAACSTEFAGGPD